LLTEFIKFVTSFRWRMPKEVDIRRRKLVTNLTNSVSDECHDWTWDIIDVYYTV